MSLLICLILGSFIAYFASSTLTLVIPKVLKGIDYLINLRKK